MNASVKEPTLEERRLMREAVIGHGLFSTRDAEVWSSYLEDLGELYGEGWSGAAQKADASSNGAFEGGFAPPLSMLLDAVKRAFLACHEHFKEKRATDIGDEVIDPEIRLKKSYLWQALTLGGADAYQAEALRAFQRGFRLGRRVKPGSTQRSSEPILDPPWYWGAGRHAFSGPSAAAERALRALMLSENDPTQQEARKQALRDLYVGAWRDNVPAEDSEWADAYRDVCLNRVNGRYRDTIAKSAYEGYLQSSNGVLDNQEIAKPWPSLSRRAMNPWCAFAERVESAPEGEPEFETAEAATREYWDARYQEAPPWASDPARIHWLAALRAARIVLLTSAFQSE